MLFCLFLDDERDPPEATKNAWKVARSYFQAICLVDEYGFPDYVSFDHDLGLGMNGYDFAKYLVALDMSSSNPRMLMPDHFNYTIHSQNPIGSENIDRFLKNYLKAEKGWNFLTF